MQVRKTKRLDNKKPMQVARKFRIDVEDVRELQRGETVELEDARARTLKQWGMVAYVMKSIPPPPVEKKRSLYDDEPDDRIDCNGSVFPNTGDGVDKSLTNNKSQPKKGDK